MNLVDWIVFCLYRFHCLEAQQLCLLGLEFLVCDDALVAQGGQALPFQITPGIQPIATASADHRGH
jgi:hypothetical protein